MRLFTIGFTRTSAESFFTRLQAGGINRVVDVRLHNVSQLAGFAKRDDLRYFLKSICGLEYVHRLDLAPTENMLDAYRKHRGSWAAYERSFVDLLRVRRIEDAIARDELDGACLLCSEDKPHHCHRRVVAEYLAARWPEVEIVHL
ncbi:MAG TPA: DUF488 domain-containing protein [Polyangiaceae bacterium]|jgi:uncharacterized protein (DUF488 family)|nr:DUF488 domain-containing protein [Polyangiaceae bacterium]